jgi:hypothetical protein
LFFAEVFSLLALGGVFFNLDCVASLTQELHARSQAVFGFDDRDAGPSDQPAVLDSQLA